MSNEPKPFLSFPTSSFWVLEERPVVLSLCPSPVWLPARVHPAGFGSPDFNISGRDRLDRGHGNDQFQIRW